MYVYICIYSMYMYVCACMYQQTDSANKWHPCYALLLAKQLRLTVFKKQFQLNLCMSTHVCVCVFAYISVCATQSATLRNSPLGCRADETTFNVGISLNTCTFTHKRNLTSNSKKKNNNRNNDDVARHENFGKSATTTGACLHATSGQTCKKEGYRLET